MNKVLLVKKDLIKTINNFMANYGMVSKESNNGTEFRTENVVISIFNSGKILIQGKEASQWEKILSENFPNIGSNIPVKNNQQQSYILNQSEIILHMVPRIGSDESGKGDFFGPLVTAAFLIKSKIVEKTLLELRVKDSKKISDSKILDLASKIKKLAPYQVVKISPSKYNDLYSKIKNVNKLLAWSHARAIENILTAHSCSLAIADQFGDISLIENALFERGKKIELIQMHKAEQNLAVAAASILARAEYITSMEAISRNIGISLPFGAGEQVLTIGTRILKTKGNGLFKEISKLHFITYQKIRNSV